MTKRRSRLLRLTALASTGLLWAFLPTASSAANASGRVVFRNGGTATPSNASYAGIGASNSFGAVGDAVLGAVNQTFTVLKASPTRNGEYLAGYVTTDGQLYVMRYSRGAWSAEYNVAVGGDGVSGRRFDIAYEKLSGRGIVVYSSNTAAKLFYKIWDPSSGTWSATTGQFNCGQAGGIPNNVKLASRPGTSEIAAGIADASNRLTALIWNGSSWGSEASPTIATVYGAGLDAFDLAYSSQAGDLFVAAANSSGSLIRKQYLRSTASWQSTLTDGLGETQAQVQVAADLVNNRVGVVLLGGDSRFWLTEWDGSIWATIQWRGGPNLIANSRTFTATYIESGTMSFLVIPYQGPSDSATTLSYAYWADHVWCQGSCGPGYGNGFSTIVGSYTATLSPGTNLKTWFQAVTDPQSRDRGMVVFGDSSNHLWAKRMVANANWPDGSGSNNIPLVTFTNPDANLGTTTSLGTTNAIAFDYDQVPPQTVIGDKGDAPATEAPTGTSACAATASSTTVYDVDHFTLATSSGTDNVTNVTVNVTAGASAIGTLYVTTDDGTPLGHASPVSGNNAIAVSISVTPTPVQYRIQVKPALYSAQGLASGADYTIAAKVATVTATNPIVGTDTNGGSVVVDRTPPSSPTWGTPPFNTVLVPAFQVNLAWTNPPLPWVKTILLRGTSGGDVATSSLTDGNVYGSGGASGADTVAYVGIGTSTADQPVSGRYYYRAFAADICNNYSAGVTTSTPAAPNPTTPLGLTGTPTTCGVVTLVAQYSGDGNNDDSVVFTRDAVTVGCTSLTRDVRNATWTCIEAVPSADATYSYTATFSDADTVSGTNTVTASVTEHACPPAGSGNLTLTAHPSGPSPTATAAPGQTHVLAGRFQLTATSSSVYVTQIALTNLGTATAADLGSVNVYADIGGTPGAWDSGDQLVASAHFSASTNVWVASGFLQAQGTTSYLVTITAAYGAVPNDTFTTRFSPANISVGFPGAVVGTTPTLTGGAVTISATPLGQSPGDAAVNSKKPMVLILNPANGATMSLDNSTPSNGVRVQAQVYDPSHTSISSVMLSHDGGVTFPDTLTRNPTYDAVVNRSGPPYYAGVFQADLISIGAGSFTLQVQATNTGGLIGYSAPIVISVNPRGSGDGNLLVRNNSNQLCIDCHAVQTHSSQATASPLTGQSRYGSWGAECRDCHTPHRTRNAQLIGESIVPPAYSAYQSVKKVRFWDGKTGDSGNANAVSFVTSSTVLTNAGTYGPCQACHTRTSSRSGTPRWQRTGNGDSHYAGSSTQACTRCHSHSNGFSGREGQGGEYCGTCHSGTFTGMQAAGSTAPNAQPHLTKHTLGASILGTNDSYLDTSATWGGTLASSVAVADRSCVNMCHGDHVHNDPAVWPAVTHNRNFYRTPATPASRALTRDATTGSPTYGYATTASTGAGLVWRDFVPGYYDRGCLGCHTSPVDASRPAVNGPAYEASAHDVSTSSGQTWEYVLHDDSRGGNPNYDSRFTRNCTKCHAGNQTEGQTPSWAGGVQGVHYSDNPSLLGGAVNPAGNAASNVCYNCHGGATPGGNVGQAFANGKNIAKLGYHATQGGQSGHPSDSSSVHDTLAESAATYGNPLGGKTRHAACLDCHDPHQAKSGPHSDNYAGPALQNALGAKLVGTLAAWTKPASASNWSVVKIQAGTDVEATLCFKCHSAFSWGSGTPPYAPGLGGGGYTDQAREFNPANGSAGGYHPVLADCSNNYSRILDLNNLSQTFVRTWSKTTRNRMTCSDCHASETAGDPLGPHGSAVGFLLRGPNTDWNSSMSVANSTSFNNNTATYKAFCFNCHDPGFASDNSWFHKADANYGAHHHNTVPCLGCHAAVQHGGPRPGMLVGTSGVNTYYGNPGSYADWDTAAPYAVATGLYIWRQPAPGEMWQMSDCGCYGPDHGH